MPGSKSDVRPPSVKRGGGGGGTSFAIEMAGFYAGAHRDTVSRTK